MKGLKSLSILFLICALGVFSPKNGHSDNMVGEELISLEATDQSLRKVLNKIAADTGYQFIFDESWENHLISTSIKNEPLYKGLKRILNNLNNVIIYRSDRTIEIIIFDEAATSANRSNAFVDRTSDDESVQRSYAFPASSTPPFPPASQEPPDVEVDNPPSEESDATDSEPDEAAPEEEEPTEMETGEAAAEATEPDGSEQNADTSGPDEKSPDESTTDN
jgi:hypothetical protein